VQLKHWKCGAVSEVADKLPKFDFPRSFAGPHFAINLNAAKSVSMYQRIFASVHESAFGPCPRATPAYRGLTNRSSPMTLGNML